MSITIRKLSIQDYDAAIELWQTSKGIGVSEGDSRQEIESYLARNPGLSFAALDAEKLIGTILGGHDGRRGLLIHMAVHPHYRRSGIARRLEACCMDALAEAGIPKCLITVYAQNQEAVDFWASAGWQMRDDLIVMSKYPPQSA